MKARKKSLPEKDVYLNRCPDGDMLYKLKCLVCHLNMHEPVIVPVLKTACFSSSNGQCCHIILFHPYLTHWSLLLFILWRSMGGCFRHTLVTLHVMWDFDELFVTQQDSRLLFPLCHLIYQACFCAAADAGRSLADRLTGILRRFDPIPSKLWFTGDCFQQIQLSPSPLKQVILRGRSVFSNNNTLHHSIPP